MRCPLIFLVFVVVVIEIPKPLGAAEARSTEDMFAAPARGFISSEPAPHWDHALLTGNGIQGAMVMGNPCAETIYLSHAAIYLPTAQQGQPLNMAKRLAEIRRMCVEGQYKDAAEVIDVLREENRYGEGMDSFTGAFVLDITQPWTPLSRYQRSVDFMTGEAHVAFANDAASFKRSLFVSRADDVIVVRLRGSGKLTAHFSFSNVPATDLLEARAIATRVKSSEHGVKEGRLYFSRMFEPNQTNPVRGYEGLGKLIVKGGTVHTRFLNLTQALQVANADEILVLIKIRPLLKAEGDASNLAAMMNELDSLPAHYDTLLARHAQLHGDLMGRVSFSLDAPASDRAKATEQLNAEAQSQAAPLAQIERVFDAGRYHVICATGYNPPNLQGLWSAKVLAPWCGDFHWDLDLPSAVAFLSMGNTPELMEPFFRLHENNLPGFRQNMKELYGMRGFFIPCCFTTSTRNSDFSPSWPHLYWHTAAAWLCQFYYNHWQYTGDHKFLEERAYPLLKETAEFYEDFLTITDKGGRLVFAPSYSPEQGEVHQRELAMTGARVNATMDVAAAKQLLRNTIAAATLLGRDEEQRRTWANLLKKMPSYEVGKDGAFREWLWPGIEDYHDHRHASHLYPLVDDMPADIVESPALVKAVRVSARKRIEYHERSRWYPTGAIFVGLAATHIGDPELVERVVNHSVRSFWGSGMNAFLDPDKNFQFDNNGSFPYLCASALVYGEPGLIRFFPARPASWTSGSLKGVRLRGAVTVKELSWSEGRARAVLVADKDQNITILPSAGDKQEYSLSGGDPLEIIFETVSR